MQNKVCKVVRTLLGEPLGTDTLFLVFSCVLYRHTISSTSWAPPLPPLFLYIQQHSRDVSKRLEHLSSAYIFNAHFLSLLFPEAFSSHRLINLSLCNCWLDKNLICSAKKKPQTNRLIPPFLFKRVRHSDSPTSQSELLITDIQRVCLPATEQSHGCQYFNLRGNTGGISVCLARSSSPQQLCERKKEESAQRVGYSCQDRSPCWNLMYF